MSPLAIASRSIRTPSSPAVPKIGEGCEIHPFAVLGGPPQDKKYRGEESGLIVGPFTTMREHVTMNSGTEGGGYVTRVGAHGLFLTAAHVAHDCQIGDHVIFSNNATLAGHVTVEDHAILGGLCAVHQFVRIGAHAFIGGMSGIEDDVIPFGMALGNRATLAGLNIVGLKRQRLRAGANPRAAASLPAACSPRRVRCKSASMMWIRCSRTMRRFSGSSRSCGPRRTGPSACLEANA